MKKKIGIATLLILSALFLSACGLFGRAASTEPDVFFEESEGAVALGLPAEAPAAEFAAEPFAEDAVVESARALDDFQSAERLVVKNADISVVVNDPAEVMDSISALADEMGGFVVSSNLFQTTTPTGIEVPSANITIRVPSDSLQEALEAIESQAVRVVSQNQSGQDVTSQYTDLQSRLRNLEDAEDLLREIMASARDTEDVLNAFNQLNFITEQIEVLKGQIQFFEESAALSAISVTLIASAADQPITIGGWEPVGVAKDAIQALIGALQGLANALIWIALYLLPIALIIGVPLWFVFRAIRRRRANSEKKS